MGLVVVAAVERDVGRAVAGLEQAAGAVEAQDARERLGRQPDLLAEQIDQVLGAAAELAGQRSDRDATSAGLEPLPRLHDARRGEPRAREAREHEGVEQLEAALPA